MADKSKFTSKKDMHKSLFVSLSLQLDFLVEGQKASKRTVYELF